MSQPDGSKPAAGPVPPAPLPAGPAPPGAGLAEGSDGRWRCSWGLSAPEYRQYHDTEWGFPVARDDTLFEKLCLEGFQAGLSWLTVLRKRPAFREAFSQFRIESVASLGEGDIEGMLANPGIIRHRGKIASTINNAGRALELQAGFGSLAAYLWQWEPAGRRAGELPALPLPPISPESHALSRDLKRRGWTFVGPTTVYAFMQAMGLVDDHLPGCWCRPNAEQARSLFTRP